MECESLLTNLKQKGFQILPPKGLPKEKIIISILESLQDEKLIGKTFIRDILIRKQYKELLVKGLSPEQARTILIEQAYKDRDGNTVYLGEDVIRNILYSKLRRH